MKTPTNAAKTTDTTNRGHYVPVPGDRDLSGRVVGVADGIKWVAWPGTDFDAMCENFDALHG